METGGRENEARTGIPGWEDSSQVCAKTVQSNLFENEANVTKVLALVNSLTNFFANSIPQKN